MDQALPSHEADVFLRPDPRKFDVPAFATIICGLVAVAFGVWLLVTQPSILAGAITLLVGVLMLLGGLWINSVGMSAAKRVVLSLTAEGLTHHEMGVLVKWTGIRDVRLRSDQPGTIYVKVANGNGEEEIALIVGGLRGYSPADIAALVLKRRRAALRQQAGTVDHLSADMALSSAANAPPEPDLFLRYPRWSGLEFFVPGIMCAGATVFLWFEMIKEWNASTGLYLAMALLVASVLSVSLMLLGFQRLFDRRPKLSVTTEGVKDHRTGVLVKWTDYRDSWLHLVTTNGTPTSATMYVKVTKGDEYQELKFNILGLERSPQDIAKLVYSRGRTALEQQTANAAVFAHIAADLRAGIPLSLTANKLVTRGLNPDLAELLVSIVAGGDLAHCADCNLDYFAGVEGCSLCGSALSRVRVPEGVAMSHGELRSVTC